MSLESGFEHLKKCADICLEEHSRKAKAGSLRWWLLAPRRLCEEKWREGTGWVFRQDQ